MAERTPEQELCEHQLLKRIMTLFGIAYRCTKCELIFEQPEERDR